MITSSPRLTWADEATQLVNHSGRISSRIGWRKIRLSQNNRLLGLLFLEGEVVFLEDFVGHECTGLEIAYAICLTECLDAVVDKLYFLLGEVFHVCLVV